MLISLRIGFSHNSNDVHHRKSVQSFYTNDNLTWLLSEDENLWSFEIIQKNLNERPNFRFDNLYVYSSFNYNEFLRIWRFRHQGTSKKNNNMKSFLLKTITNHGDSNKEQQFTTDHCINTNCGIISTTYREHIYTDSGGWFNSQFESILRKDWCDEKLKGENCIFFFSKMRKSLDDHKVSHFSSESLLNLLKNYDCCAEDFFFPAPHFFDEIVADIRNQIMKESCLRCKKVDVGVNDSDFEHLCDDFDFKNKTVYICRHFEWNSISFCGRNDQLPI